MASFELERKTNDQAMAATSCFKVIILAHCGRKEGKQKDDYSDTYDTHILKKEEDWIKQVWLLDLA